MIPINQPSGFQQKRVRCNEPSSFTALKTTASGAKMPTFHFAERPMTKRLAFMMVPLTFLLASLPQTSQASFTFQFVSTAGVHEAEIVIDLPASNTAAIHSLTVLSTNDFSITPGPVGDFSFGGLLILDEAGTRLISGRPLDPNNYFGTFSQIWFRNALGQIGTFNLHDPESLYPNYAETIYLPGTANWNYTPGEWELTSASAVPEPSSLVMLSSLTLIALGVVCFRKRRNSAATNP